MVSPSSFSAWMAPAESNWYSPVGWPFTITGSACMQRSATCISLVITHSRSRPVLRIALPVAALASS